MSNPDVWLKLYITENSAKGTRILYMNNKTTVGIYTLGCKVNQYESQAIKEAFEKKGMNILPFSEACDIYVINSCAVTEESTRKARQIIRRAIRLNPEAYVLVTGCAAQLQPELISEIPGVDFVCGNRNKMDVVDFACALAESGRKLPKTQNDVRPVSGKIEKMHIESFDRVRAYVKIQDGCNAKCAYCIIPKLRGDICSRPRSEVIEEVRKLAEAGCPEVVLTGIETSAYDADLPKLISEINEIPEIKQIRLGSLDPSFMKPEISDAIAVSEKAVHHFHLSMQSGCDRTLAAMRRKYNTRTALSNMRYIRSIMPDVNFSTDIMTGFPGETDEDFEKTLDFVKEAEFLHIHIFPYSSRPGTEAAEMPEQIPEEIKALRAARLAELQRTIKSKKISEAVRTSKEMTVLIEHAQNGALCGHTPNFFEVQINEGASPKYSDTDICKIAGAGDIVRVRPTGSNETVIFAQLLDI